MTSQTEQDTSNCASDIAIKSFGTPDRENEEHGREIKELKATVLTYVAHLEKENKEQKKRIEELEQQIKYMNELFSRAPVGAGMGHHMMKLDADTTCWYWTRHSAHVDSQ